MREGILKRIFQTLMHEGFSRLGEALPKEKTAFCTNQKGSLPLGVEEIQFTPAALEALAQMKQTLNVPPDYFLRLGIREQAGCLGVSHLIGFDRKRENDRETEAAGWKIIFDRRHGMHILGMRVDYEDRGEEKGFVFKDPRND